ncbi:MAG: hypothetical protein ABIX01_12185 [Chitinophagaceae bacterium]
MKKVFLSCLGLVCAVGALCNSAMPGLWEAGANGRFVPLFAGDSMYLGKIRMQHELVLVNLYPGFAVVKGEYYMYNTSDETINMHVAYPKQATYSDTIVQNVIPAYIDGLQVLVNEVPVALMRKNDPEFDSLVNAPNSSVHSEVSNTSENWFVWKMSFPPKSYTKITVYFLTDNSHAKLRRGYSGDEGQAFSYVLESGRAWGGDIDSGKICVALKNGLTTKDVKGVLPFNALMGDATHLLYQFVNKEPESKDNMLIWYQGAATDLAFEKNIVPAAGKYYTEIDSFDIDAFSNHQFTALQLTDLEVHATSPFAWIFYGILGFAAIIIFMIIYGAYRLIAKRNRAQ